MGDGLFMSFGSVFQPASLKVLVFLRKLLEKQNVFGSMW